MMKNLYLPVVLLLFSQFVFCQNLNEKYNELRKEVNNSPDNVIKESRVLKEKALKTNTLDIVSKTDYITSFAFYLKGSPDSCIYYANAAIESAKKNNYSEGEALGLRILGTQYAKMGLLDKSRELLDQALVLVSRKQNDEAYEIKGGIYGSLLVLMDNNEELDKKIIVAQKAINSYLKVSKEASKKELLPSAYTNLSYLYSKTKKYDSAYVYSQKALEFINVNDTYKLAFTYHDIGYLLAAQGKYSEAIQQYEKALSYCKGESFYDKKLEILKGLSEAYGEAGDSKNALYYLQQYQKLYLNGTQKNQHAVNEIYNTASKPASIKVIPVLITTACIAFGLAAIYFFLIYKKKSEKINNPQEEKKETLQTDINISTETEEKILYHLNEFEKQEAFIDKEISLYSLANKFQCNTKYLSLVIKRHKNKSFVQYINDLRIQYVINKLNTDTNFSKFKIYYLAELSGFSSQRAFASAFFNNTQMKPLEYIKKYHSKE
ncbi:tetratricopeptide repeat protein [Elizabethkingia meningoseptica]|uniref:tetratricopeptide repeat protein n=1 Tax=Elizabethkingia meningoseptica TaxID=238 RepID=UPI0038919B7C